MTNNTYRRSIKHPDYFENPSTDFGFFPKQLVKALEKQEAAEVEKCTEIVSKEKFQEIRTRIINNEITRQKTLIADSEKSIEEITGVKYSITIDPQAWTECCLLYSAPMDQKFWDQIRAATGLFDTFSKMIGSTEEAQRLTHEMLIALDQTMKAAGALTDQDRKLFLKLSFALSTHKIDKDNGSSYHSEIRSVATSATAKTQLMEEIRRDDTEGRLAAISQNLLDELSPM